MNRYRWLAILLIVAGVVAVVTVVPLRKGGSGAPAAQSREQARIEHVKISESSPAPVRGIQGRSDAHVARNGSDQRPLGADAIHPGAEADPGVKTAREESVDAWESAVNQLLEQEDMPTFQQARHVKEVFDKLDKEDRLDCIAHALNLLPDEQFPALCAILYDKKEDPDVLDAIFSDALNRPEEIKTRLMTELRKDREHPMYVESARILEITESESPEEGARE